jgi:hypothetical protein
MRTADVCPTCATFTNALCIIYDGSPLLNTLIIPGDDLQLILGKLNANLVPRTGTGAPTISARYLGQLYVDTAFNEIYSAIGIGGGASDWTRLLSVIVPANLSEYVDNAAAISGGLTIGRIYRTGDLVKIVH